MRFQNVTKINETIIIGQRGENLANQIRFPIVDIWKRDYGKNGLFVVTHQRSEDAEPYPVANTSIHGKDLCWDITNVDTEYEGEGVIQIQYLVNNVVAKSMCFNTMVTHALGTVTETVEAPAQAWIDEITEVGAKAVLYANQAKTSQTKAQQYASNAAASANAALTSEQTAAQYAANINGKLDSAIATANQAIQAVANIGDAEEVAVAASVTATNAATQAAAALEEVQELADTIDDKVTSLEAEVDMVQESLNDKLDGARVEEGYLILSANGVDKFTISGIGGGSGGGGGGGSSEGDNDATMTLRNLSGWSSKDVTSTDACTISATWSSTLDGLPTGNGTLTVVIGSAVKYTRNLPQGNFTVDVAPYLSIGANNVYIRVTDAYGNVKRLLFNITVVSLTMSSNFDYISAYQAGISVPFTFTPVSSLTKTAYLKVDGEIKATQENITTSGRQLSLAIPAQTHGLHSIDCYCTAALEGGDIVESNHLFYDLIYYDNTSTTPIVAIDYQPTSAVHQYETVAIPYRVYNPASATAAIQIYLNNSLVQSLNVDRTQQTFSYQFNTAGSNNIKIKCGTVTREYNLTIEESDINVSPTTENLDLYLTSTGRSNNEANPATWSYGTVNATMTGFNLVSDGWVLDDDNITVLRVMGDARISIPYKPFSTDFRSTGKTLEFEFATRDVINYDTPIISCMSGNRGFQITATEALIKSAQSQIKTQYKENEHVRISFVVEKRVDHRLLQCYINGILSGVVQYPADDDFQQITPVNITIGSNDCAVDIYNIRIYNNNLTRYQIVDNWIADTQNGALMLQRYKENDIFNANGEIVFSKLPSDLPYMVLQADVLPTYKGDKKTGAGYYVNPQDPTKNFTFTGASIDVQGTSSQYYARKNYKIKFSNFYVNGSTEAVTKYSMRTNAVPTNTFTFKADVASSEGANNVELVRLYNDTCVYKTPPQTENANIRQGIDGFPIVMFQEKSDNSIVFLGKYNFNNDKGTPEVFGFTSGDESWETLDNTLALTQFKDLAEWHDPVYAEDGETVTDKGWTAGFEGRYPKDCMDVSNLKVLAAWINSTDTTAATGDALEEPVTYGDIEYLTDSAEYRLAKFKNELPTKMVLNDVLFYYIFTELFLMVDSRVKNSFPSYFNADGKWCFLPYDMDTAIGM